MIKRISRAKSLLLQRTAVVSPDTKRKRIYVRPCELIRRTDFPRQEAIHESLKPVRRPPEMSRNVNPILDCREPEQQSWLGLA
jgi:hypothetical protein